ncbi:MAG TPA: arginase family protein [Gemmatimonadaceae bacterium]|nr:arginase family protein [Gemmatimonadaceae bacterium]
MDIQILAVPYDSGHRGLRMGAGPEALLKAGLPDALRQRGHTVHVRVAELDPDRWQAEIQSSFELMRMLSAAVTEARAASRFPIILAGNCNTAVGTLAGLGADPVGVAWFDAHADFNTPETTTSGFLDGTAVAIISGRCWTQLAATVPGFSPVADERICLIGTRDVDSLESALLDDSSVSVVAPRHLREQLSTRLQGLSEHVERIYVHLDLDVLDASIAAANTFAVSGGLTLDDMRYALSTIAGRLEITAVTLSAFDPEADRHGAAARAAIDLISTAAGLVSRP